jgi:hypothetical protein
MSFLDTLIYGYRTAYAADVALTQRNKINFGVGLTAVDNPATGATDVKTGGASVPIAALAIDWTAGAVFTKALATGGNVFTFAGAASGMVIIVRLTGHASGSTVTWPTVLWPGGVAPTQTSTGKDVYTFVHDGTNIYGSVVQAMA